MAEFSRALSSGLVAPAQQLMEVHDAPEHRCAGTLATCAAESQGRRLSKAVRSQLIERVIEPPGECEYSKSEPDSPLAFQLAVCCAQGASSRFASCVYPIFGDQICLYEASRIRQGGWTASLNPCPTILVILGGYDCHLRCCVFRLLPVSLLGLQFARAGVDTCRIDLVCVGQVGQLHRLDTLQFWLVCYWLQCGAALST